MINSQTRDLWLAMRPSRLLRAWGHCVAERFPALQSLHVEIDDSSLPKYHLEDREAQELWDEQDTPGTLVNALASLPKLTHLKCHASMLTDDHLREIARLTAIEKLMLTFHERHNHEEDDLDDDDPTSRVTTEGLSSILQLTNLTVLHLVQCPPALEDDVWLQSLPLLSRLTDLVITHYECLQDATVGTIAAGMPQLTALELSWCVGITNEAVASLRPLTNLQTLRITGDEDSFQPGWLEHVAALPSLSTLLITDRSEMQDDELMCVSKLTNLTSLNINGCSALTNESVAHIAALSGLRELSLSGLGGLTDKGVLTLGKLSSLKILGIQHCASVEGSSFCAYLPRRLTHIILLCNGMARTRDLVGLSALPKSIESLYLSAPSYPGPQQAGFVMAALTKVFGSLTNLRHLTLNGFKGLTVPSLLSAIQPLTSLRELGLPDCVGISREACAALQAGHSTLPSVQLDAIS